MTSSKWLKIAALALLLIIAIGHLPNTGEALAQAAAGADGAESLGIDEKIDLAFKPVAEFFGGAVFCQIPEGVPYVGGVPFVLLLLVFSALFFTIAFGFVNIVHFPTALKVVCGKYDKLDHHSADEKAEVNIVDGDVAVG